MQLDTPCIEWAGPRHRTGYGRVTRNGKTIGAHRAAWEDANGPIPDGMQVRHLCDNPPCVNVEHLAIGTAKDNGRDRVLYGRNGAACRPQPECARIVRAADALRVDLGLGHVEFARDYIRITDGMWSMLRRGRYACGYSTWVKLDALLKLHGRESVPFFAPPRAMPRQDWRSVIGAAS